ncbi:MAG: crossover junction endodeoxyribonuclease RuvC [Chlamydiales bacterium]
MIVIGIDPGTRVTGYGIVEAHNQMRKLVEYGCIRPPGKAKLSERYHVIFNDIEYLLNEHKPDVLAVETQYVDKNVQSAIKLGMARGVIILAATRKGIPVYEYAPTKAKMAVVGSGRASKQQVQGMVKLLLNLPTLPEPEDAADALALALCHLNSINHKLTIGSEI